jgi:hypothetical protein
MYGLGSLVKSIGKAAKKIVKSPIGKAALAGTGIYALGGGIIPGVSGKILPFAKFGSSAGSGFGIGNILPNLANIFGAKNIASQLAGQTIGGQLKSKFGLGVAGALGAGALASLSNLEEEEREMVTQNVDSLKNYLRSYYTNLGYGADEIEKFVARDTSEYGYAEGGRVDYAMGSPEDNAREAAGIMDLPLNENPAGVTELDLRETGGFIPPVGVKEKADDIPAMLSNNEFVFTADAVRGMGEGDVNKGAERMYSMMKQLENGGRV